MYDFRSSSNNLTHELLNIMHYQDILTKLSQMLAFKLLTGQFLPILNMTCAYHVTN